MTTWLKEHPLLTKVGAGFVVLAVLGGLALLVVAPWKELPDGVAIKVGDQEVTVRDLQRRTDVLEALYGLREPADQAGADQFRRAAAQTVATSMVVDDVARDRGISIPDQDVQQQLDQLVAAREKTDGRGGWARLLTKIGAADSDVKDELRRRLTHEKLFDEIKAGVPAVTDADLLVAYEQHKADYTVPDQRRISNIVTASQDDAQKVLDQVRGGADFGSVARQFSLDRTTRDNGGDLGPVTLDQLEGDYGTTAFGAALSVPFGPVKTEHGWNVGEVTQVVPGRQLSFDEARDRIKAATERDRALHAWEGWLNDQVAQHDVSYADIYRPADPSVALPPAAPATGGDPAQTPPG